MKATCLRGRPPRRRARQTQRHRQLLVAIALLLLPPVAIQSPAAAAEPDFGTYDFQGSALPYYFCVKGFYLKLAHSRDAGAEAWAVQLEDLGIKYGSESEAALMDALGRFEAEVDGRTQDLTPYEDDPVAWDQAQTEFLVALVDNLRHLHLEALDRLEIEGHSRWDVDAYINRVVRPSVTVTSSPGLNETNFEILAGLDDLTRGGLSDG